MIECPQIRKAWDNRKTAKQNLRDMGLAVGSKGVLPVNKARIALKCCFYPTLQAKDGPVDQTGLLKPYVIKEMEAEASLPTIDKTTCSNDMIEFLQHMIKEHNEDYKAMARDEKNYYQDTPKQIKRKVDLYKRCHPEEYATFIASLETGSSSGML
ncbi:hypothetical protein P4O66_016568 [Electrophorus voltai]|uniref:Nucleolar protein 16 n=1 Tax=Electrophorus voltai TaxID=2609070 RepID=A0AAD8YYM9_9TELE|nr:hypothetical protein P4O66_016568 [Electrophorus voltai]